MENEIGVKVCGRKNCPHGKVRQPRSNFAKSHVTRDGLAGICKDCMRDSARRCNAKKKEGLEDFFKMFL